MKFASRIPGALPCYDIMDVAEKIYVVMPYFDGADVFSLAFALSEMMTPEETGASALMTYVGHSIATALETFHSCSVVHNDVRVENMLWSSAGEIALADLGKACDLNAGPMSPLLFDQQLSFVAPEYFHDDAHIDAKIDIWSFGVSLFNVWLANGQDIHNPFLLAKYLCDDSATELTEQQAQYSILIAWALCRRAYMMAGRVVRGSSFPEDSIYAMFETLLEGLEKEDKELCDFMVGRVLNPGPRGRADAREVAAFMRLHLTASRRDVATGLLRRAYDDPAYLSHQKAVALALQNKARTQEAPSTGASSAP